MRDGIYIVDGDGHVLDGPHYKRYLPEKYAHRAALFPSQGWDRRQAPNGDLGRAPANAREQLADNDQEGIDLQILYPTAALNVGELRDPEYQADICRAYNDFVHDFCQEDPTRLKAVCVVPVLDPTEACRELNRAVADLSAVGLMFPTYLHGRNVAERFFWPIYEEAERLGVPIAFHASGNETSDIRRFDTFTAVHAWSHLPEQMISLISVVYGGLFERFRSLRIGFMEAGCGWVPFMLDHLDGEWEKRRWEVPLCKERPSAYLTGGRAYYSCETEERTIPYVAQWVGDDHLLYASDYPHWDTEWPKTVSTLLERTDVSPATKRRILSENALAFYGLAAPVPA